MNADFYKMLRELVSGYRTKCFNDAKQELYPFGNEDEDLYRPPEARNIKKALSKQDLKKIFEYQAEKGSPEQFASDMFIFS